MSIFIESCQSFSNKKIFGLCDDLQTDKKPAYIDELDGSKWIAVVENENTFDVTFTALDNCVESKKKDGNKEKQCDGVLTYNNVIIFVELKERTDKKESTWIEEGESQLRASIQQFNSLNFEEFRSKKAYIVNSKRPKERQKQASRMEKFEIETGYILRIQSRIIL